MERDLHRPISLKELSRAAGLSVPQRIRRYRAETSCTPGRWLQRLRAEKSLNLLLSTHDSLRDIARQVGVSTVPRMSALIAKWTGRNASALRRRGR